MLLGGAFKQSFNLFHTLLNMRIDLSLRLLFQFVDTGLDFFQGLLFQTIKDLRLVIIHPVLNRVRCLATGGNVGNHRGDGD